MPVPTGHSRCNSRNAFTEVAGIALHMAQLGSRWLRVVYAFPVGQPPLDALKDKRRARCRHIHSTNLIDVQEHYRGILPSLRSCVVQHWESI